MRIATRGVRTQQSIEVEKREKLQYLRALVGATAVGVGVHAFWLRCLADEHRQAVWSVRERLGRAGSAWLARRGLGAHPERPADDRARERSLLPATRVAEPALLKGGAPRAPEAAAASPSEPPSEVATAEAMRAELVAAKKLAKSVGCHHRTPADAERCAELMAAVTRRRARLAELVAAGGPEMR
jgi:hypothetical protein